MLLVRVRGWHLEEKHIICDGCPMAGALVDFGLHFFHNLHVRVANGTAPYFYLPKMESRFECRLWNEVFQFSEDYMKVQRGSKTPSLFFSSFISVSLSSFISLIYLSLLVSQISFLHFSSINFSFEKTVNLWYSLPLFYCS